MTQATTPLVRTLFDLPERVGKGDFVLKLTEGVAKAARTIGSYVPTPSLVDAFSQS